MSERGLASSSAGRPQRVHRRAYAERQLRTKERPSSGLSVKKSAPGGLKVRGVKLRGEPGYRPGVDIIESKSIAGYRDG